MQLITSIQVALNLSLTTDIYVTYDLYSWQPSQKLILTSYFNIEESAKID